MSITLRFLGVSNNGQRGLREREERAVAVPTTPQQQPKFKTNINKSFLVSRCRRVVNIVNIFCIPISIAFILPSRKKCLRFGTILIDSGLRFIASRNSKAPHPPPPLRSLHYFRNTRMMLENFSLKRKRIRTHTNTHIS